MSQNLKVSELDFDAIKQNLKDFLRSKPEFTDYNFEGSGLSVILDLLAYNTHYNAITANMLVQELFLDTSTKRETAALHAKRLGYTPVSARAASAKVRLEVFPALDAGNVSIGSGASFSGRAGNQVFTFVTNEAATAQKDPNGRYIFEELTIYEGVSQRFRYVFKENDINQAFVIPSKNVDTSLLRVKVQKSLNNTETVFYQPVTDFARIEKDTRVYFLKLNQEGFYEVYFGDNIIGQKPQEGNVVILEYIITNKTLGNDITNFTFSDSVDVNATFLTSTIQKSSGGAEPESVESIKFNAQKNTIVQNRAVTADDYAALIPTFFSADSISVWGGESADPPVYGKVFIAIKQTGNFDLLTENKKNEIKSFLRNSKNVVTVIPEIVDPKFVDVVIETSVYYDDTLTKESANTLRFLVLRELKDYSTRNLNKFDKEFRYSDVVAAIDATDPAIISNITKIKMKTQFTPELNFNTKYVLSFDNPIKESSNKEQSIVSTKFRVVNFDQDLTFEDNNGILSLVFKENNVKKIFKQNAGSVNYDKGIISLDSINIVSAENNAVSVTCIPATNDLFSLRDKILVLRDENINVNMIVEDKDKTRRIFTVS